MLGANILGSGLWHKLSARQVRSSEDARRRKDRGGKDLRHQKSEIRRTRDPQIGGRSGIREIGVIRGLDYHEKTSPVPRPRRGSESTQLELFEVIGDKGTALLAAE